MRFCRLDCKAFRRVKDCPTKKGSFNTSRRCERVQSTTPLRSKSKRTAIYNRRCEMRLGDKPDTAIVGSASKTTVVRYSHYDLQLDADSISFAHSIHEETHAQRNTSCHRNWQTVLGHRACAETWIKPGKSPFRGRCLGLKESIPKTRRRGRGLTSRASCFLLLRCRCSCAHDGHRR